MNVTKTITVQNYKCTKKHEWNTHSVKAKSQAGNIWVEDIMTIQKGQSCKILS